MSYIKIPNLPEREVTHAVASCEISQKAEEKLLTFGVNITKTSDYPTLYDGIKSHPDMQFHHFGDSKFIFAPQTHMNICSYVNCGEEIGNKYPCDVKYNVARVGSYAICNKIHTEKSIIDYYNANGVEIIDIRQGYAKCNVCVVADSAIITSDAGIATETVRFGIDTLLVDDKTILLKNFNHGFIGGATGKIAPDKLAVNGNINLHKNAKEIIAFAKKYSVEVISLSDENICDIGSIIPICEK